METETRKLIHNMLDTGYDTFNEEVIRDAKRQLIDLAGTMVSGYNGPGNAALFDLVRQWGGNGEATILVHGDKVPLPHTAMINSLQARCIVRENSPSLYQSPESPNQIPGIGHIHESIPLLFQQILLYLLQQFLS